MKEIEFRGKEINSNRWVYGYYFKAPLTSEVNNTKFEDGLSFLCGKERHCISQNNCVFEVSHVTVGQYTGLKDKNGKKIFEGDIVTLDFIPELKIKGTIELIEGTFSVRYPERLNRLPEPLNSWILKFDNRCEVIGKIYENPELLEG